jgi:eukaryotic-like serine/threonine-protein kinase
MSIPLPSIGQILGHYRIVEKIGAGGVGVVYRAHDLQLERDVAIKVLPAGMLAGETARKRFRKEALSLARLNHPNIATIFEFGSQDGTDFLVAEYIPGITLDIKLIGGPLPTKNVSVLGAQLAQGLAAAHEQGVVHRDLKPGNLRLTPDGRIKILDFGLAQWMPYAGDLGLAVTMTKSQEVTGTLPYMAPEQLRGGTADARSDIWAVGAVLYEMATGKQPFPEPNAPLLIDAILNRAPTRPSKINGLISPGLENVILKALNKDPAARYQMASELGADLDRLTAGVTPLAAKPGLKWPWIATGCAFLVVGLAVGGYFARRNWSGTLNSAATVGKSAIKPRRSVAVLGFVNLTGKPDQAWLSTALSEMLSTELAAGGNLLTIPGESVAQMKASLSLPDADSYGRETLAKIRKNLGADEVVQGSYLALRGGKLRLDLKLEDATSGEIVDSVTENGTETQISDLVSRAGTALRDKLGAGAISSDQAAQVTRSLPTNPNAARRYAEGLALMHAFDYLGARDSLQSAVLAEPNFALAHSALALAWRALGYNAKARIEAKKGFDLSAGLEQEQRLWVEGQYHDVAHQWEEAVETYRTLFRFFPDNLEYGLRLANVQTFGGKPKDALLTVDQLRKLPPPSSDDPRIDIAEGFATSLLGDYKRELTVATHADESAAKLGARLERARALMLEGQALNALGQPKPGVAKAEEAKEILFLAGDRDMAAAAINRVAVALVGQGDYAAAKARYEQALSIWQEVGDQGKVASAYNNLGQILKQQGDLANANGMYQRALAAFRETEDKNSAALTLGNIGNLQNSAGDLSDAKITLEKALGATKEIGNKDLEETDLINLADVLYLKGDPAAAQELLHQAEPLLAETGDQSDVVDADLVYGEVLLGTGDLPGARAKYAEALNLSNGINARQTAAAAGLGLADVAIEQERPADAESPCRHAIAEFQAEKNTSEEIAGRAILARALLAMGKTADAQSEINSAKSLVASSQNLGIRLQMAVVVARVRSAIGRTAEAERVLQTTLLEATKSGFFSDQLEARYALGEIEMKSGKAAEGQSRLAAVEKDATAKGFLLIARKVAQIIP